MRSSTIFTPRWRGLRRGFTLIETAVATMVISIAVVSMCELLAAGTSVNVGGTEMTTAVNLAGAIHEMAIARIEPAQGEVIGPRQTIWELKDVKFSPAVDGRRQPIPGCSDWTQQVAVETVDNKDVSTITAEDRSGPTVRLTVSVYHQGRYVYTGSWLMTADDPL